MKWTMPKSPSCAHPRQLPLTQRFGYRLSIISRALAQHMVLYVGREFGLNLAEYRILTVLADRDSSSIKDIAAPTSLDKAHVTRALANLFERGMATQVVDPDDRRLRVVELTAAGRAVVAAALPFSLERHERLERCLTATELRIFSKALAVLTDEAERMLAEEEKGAHRKAAGQSPVQIMSGNSRRRQANARSHVSAGTDK
jgi:DNA-binding MarR family transcriptional regulator